MMRKFVVNPVVAVVLALSVSAAACSKGNSASSPVAPSAPATVAAPAAPVSGGATVSGMVVTGAATSALASPASFISPLTFATLGSAGKVTVSVNGTSISVISDDNGNFTLQNVPAGTLTLTISGNGFSAQVTLPEIGASDQLRVTVRVNGGTATLDDQEVDSPDKVEVEGTIGSVSGLTSSGGTIVVGRMNTAVLVNGTTSITKGGTTLKPNDLTVGLRVHVRATRSGSTLTATTVIVQNTTPDSSNSDKSKSDDNETDNDANEVNFSGTVAGTPTGSCATSLIFMVGSTKVVTNASTKFDNVTCSTLASGDSVKGDGQKQSDGSVLASEVEKQSSGSGKH